MVPLTNPRPVAVRARLDQPLSRWLWLVKWVLPWVLVGLVLLVLGSTGARSLPGDGPTPVGSSSPNSPALVD